MTVSQVFTVVSTFVRGIQLHQHGASHNVRVIFSESSAAILVGFRCWMQCAQSNAFFSVATGGKVAWTIKPADVVKIGDDAFVKLKAYDYSLVRLVAEGVVKVPKNPSLTNCPGLQELIKLRNETQPRALHSLRPPMLPHCSRHKRCSNQSGGSNLLLTSGRCGARPLCWSSACRWTAPSRTFRWQGQHIRATSCASNLSLT